MKQKKNFLTYLISVAIPLGIGGISAWINAGKMDSVAPITPPLSPPAWVFPIVWSILFLLMGIAAAKVYQSRCSGKGDALFIYGVQLAVNLLWTVFYFTFQALLLSFFWLLFLIALVLLMIVRFERCTPGAGKLNIPYLTWLCFAAYLNLATWIVNTQ